MAKIFYLLVPLFIICCHPTSKTEERGAIGEHGGVATAHPIATEVGLKVLQDGGNAFDAAIAVHFTLSVVYPRAGNIGGGGFAVYRLTDGEIGSLDFREKAPGKAHADMYLGEDQNPDPSLSRDGILAAGIPGSVEGMVQLHNKFGSLAWEALLAPAIHYASHGVVLTKNEADILNNNSDNIRSFNTYEPVFLNPQGWEEGDKLLQPELAKTLQIIQKSGRKGFYEGAVADQIVAEMQKQDGIITRDDLKNYSAIWRKPVVGNYKNFRVISMAPPSSGGIALLQLLKGIENYPIADWGHNSAKTIHVMTELQRRVYADRTTYLGDPDFIQVPVNQLLDADYIDDRFSDIDLEKATASSVIKEGFVEQIESIETTHYSIVDAQKNAVSITTTLNGNFGSKVVVEGAGFFLNNEMDDFTAKPGHANMFGLVGGKPNIIEPGKRMLSSMTPTILEKDNDLFMVVGTPGGSTIITSVFQTILNVTEHGMGIQQAINAKKLHHQWLPDHILVETGAIDSLVLEELKQLGHETVPVSKIGRMEAILIRADGRIEAGADYTRGDDKSLAY